MNNKVEMFVTVNDTNKWAVIVDGYYQLFDSQAQAEAIYGKLVPDGIESSNFGSIQLLPPHYAPAAANPKRPLGKLDQISLHEPTDLLAYAEKMERELQERIAKRRAESKNDVDPYDLLYGN